MDGDFPDLPALIEIKLRHKAFLMIDEAHSLGVLGKTGKGIREHFGIDGQAVDIWMGTLSKTLAGCGGFVAGERTLVEHLKYAAPGFVYSVGLSPPLAAASLQALRIMLQEPQRVRLLSEISRRFLEQMKTLNVNTGYAQGYGVVPAIVGSSVKASQISSRFFEAGISVQPIIFPAVEEKSARLRFFLSAMHTEENISYTLKMVSKLMP
jgi:8-amino-7-oxononanoate synthase